MVMKKNVLTRSLFTIAMVLGNYCLQAQDSLAAFKLDSGYHISFDGVKIYYEVRGEGKPIVLVHGFMNSSENWKRKSLYADLLLKGYKVITLDQRGNGKSDKPHTDEAYANDAEAKDIMGLLKFLKIGKYQAIGYSRGSIITARLLVLDSNITAAVLGGMGDGFTNPEWPRRILFYRALGGEDVPELKAAMDNVAVSGLDRTALMYMQKHQPSTLPSQLGVLKQKVLLISGDEDNDNGSVKALGKMIPNSIIIRVPGVHNTAWSTKLFADAVIKFLDGN